MPALTRNMLVEFRPDEPDRPTDTNTEPCPRLVERMLQIAPSGISIWMIKIFDPHALPILRQYSDVQQAIESGSARILELDPYAYLCCRDQDIPDEDKAYRNERWKVIEPLVTHPGIFQSEVRGPLVSAIANNVGKGAKKAGQKRRGKLRRVEDGFSKTSIYDLLRRYWQRGQVPNAMLPDYERCGAKGKERQPPTNDAPKRGRPSELSKARGEGSLGINATSDVVALLKRGYKLYYCTRKKRPWTVAFRKTIAHLFNRGYQIIDGKPFPVIPPVEELPTLRQFRYHNMKDRDLERELRSREGDRYFETNLRPLLGTSLPEEIGPGWLFEIDATYGGVMLVRKDDRRQRIGQAIVYTVIDVFSSLILGIYVGLEEPSWLAAMLALENAMTDKVDFCKGFDIEIDPEEWPYCCPKGITGDRGEMKGFSANNIPSALGVDIHNTRPYGPEWKGTVENSHHSFKERIVRGQPGDMEQSIVRGDPDPVDNACLSLYNFTRLMIFHVLHHNAEHRIEDHPMARDMIIDHVDPYPLDLWRWGIQRKMGSPRMLARDVIRLNLLPDDEASVSREGIYFRGLWYGSQLAMQEQWYLKARNGRFGITVAYEPRLVDTIYLRGDRGQLLDRCVLLPRSRRFSGLSWVEATALIRQQKLENDAAASRALQAQIALDTRIDHEVNEARKETRAAEKEKKVSRQGRKKTLPKNRREERDAERKAGAWKNIGGQETTEQPTVEPDRTPGEPSTTEYVGRPENLDKLEKILRNTSMEVQDE